MIEVRSFLRFPDGSFRDVEECSHVPTDFDYIEGAIELKIDGVEIIGKREWDYVDQLWAYIANMVHEIGVSARVSTYFPDQPILLAFESAGKRVLVTSEIGGETRRASIDRNELIATIRVSGDEFFARMSKLAPGNSASYLTAQMQLSGGNGR